MSAKTKEASTIYLSQLDRCLPASALSPKLQKRKWQLIPYEARQVAGTMVGAASFINAPEISLPLDVSGWHAIYLGYWNPHMTYDGAFELRVKLDNDPAFQKICEPEAGPNPVLTATYIHEAFFKHADLTRRKLIIGKSNGPMGRQCYLAYVKLVPLSPQQAKEIQKDQTQTKTRNLISAIDGYSYFFGSDYSRPEDILQLVEQYRHSDVAKVLWAVNYGEAVNYPSKVPFTHYLAGKNSVARFIEGTPPHPYANGEKQTFKTLTAFAKKGIIPQQIAADHVHSMGLKFDIMFRLGILGRILNGFPFPSEFIHRFPEFRQVLRDGTIVDKASYAFPEVRRFMLSLIEEAVEKFDVDGINLCFVRGPKFLVYEKPILDAFKEKYGMDARKVKPTDRRLWEIRAGFMTDFVRKAREILARIGRKKGKKLELSAWIWPWNGDTWCGKHPLEEGLDAKTWITEGLLDSIINHEWICKEYLALCKTHGCKLSFYPRWWGNTVMDPRAVTRAYKAGVSSFAIWDMDYPQTKPDEWSWIRRIGHRKEMAQWNPKLHKTKSVQITKLNGLDAAKTLEASVYSGG
jgi:hypothetical protein